MSIGFDPDARLFEVREEFKRTLLLGFRQIFENNYYRIYLFASGTPGGGRRGDCTPAARTTRRRRVAGSSTRLASPVAQQTPDHKVYPCCIRGNVVSLWGSFMTP